MTDPSSPDSPPPRTTGGNWRWTPPTPESLEAQLPGYTVEKLIGQGGMGAVYKGFQTSLDRPVAIKILPSGIEKEETNFAERFRNEARVMARLMHPAIVAVFDFGQTGDGQLYFVMEYVDGTDVHQMISSQGKLSAEHALAITAHVCDALTAAHALGIVHRDIKPANVLINSQGQIKVADFGLAKIDESGDHGLTKTGYSMGTPDYVAPESLILGVNVDGRADIYAVGVMLYQMLCGEVPRGAFKSPSEKVPGLDPRFDAIIIKAMQSERSDRYQSAVELRRDLDVILTVPLVQAGDRGPGTAALPQKALEHVPGQRSAVKVMVRGKRSTPAGGTAPVRPDSAGTAGNRGKSPARSSGGGGVGLIVGLSLAAAVVGGLVLFFLFGGGKRGDTPAGPPATVAAANPAPAPAPATPPGDPVPSPLPKPEPAPSPAPKAPQPVAENPTPPPPAKPDPEPKKESAPAEPAKMAAVPANPAPSPSPTPAPAPVPVPAPEPVAPAPSLAEGRMPPIPATLPADVAQRLAQIDAQFQTAYDRDIAPGHNTAVADLDTKYASAVQRALDTATQAGQLEDSVGLRAEQDRLAAKGRLPAVDLDSVVDTVKKLRDTYRGALAKLEAGRFAKAKPYHDRHDQLLDAYQKELTQQKRLPDALAVKARRDGLTEALAALAPKPVETAVADAGATKGNAQPPKAALPTPPPPPAKPVKVPEGTTVESVMAAIFKIGGKFDVMKDGKKVRVDDPTKMVLPPFEVIELWALERPAGSPDFTDEMLASLSVMSSLELIAIGSEKMEITSLAPLVALTKLKSIRISATDVGVPEKELLHLGNLKELESVIIKVADRTGETLVAFQSYPKLETLHLNGDGRITAKGGEAIATLTPLKILRMDNLDRISQSRFSSIATLPNVEELHLGQTVPTAEFLGHVAQFPKLLHLAFTGSGELPAQPFAALKPAGGRLVSIYAGYHSHFTDDGVKELVATLPNLEAFTHQWNPNGDKLTAKSLVELAKLPKLKKLYLTPRTNADCAFSVSMPALEELEIGSPNVTDAVFEHLKFVPNLKLLILRGTKATPAAADQFKKVRPDVKVLLEK
jgi:outer membrane biosynthesis protein TonB